jgi:hypothetical protein
MRGFAAPFILPLADEYVTRLFHEQTRTGNPELVMKAKKTSVAKDRNKVSTSCKRLFTSLQN